MRLISLSIPLIALLLLAAADSSQAELLPLYQTTDECR